MNNNSLRYTHPSFAGKMGVARADITPPPGIYARNWGAATADIAEGVHRPLTATVLTIQPKDQSAAFVLVSLDLLCIRVKRHLDAIVERLTSAYAVPSARIMVHTCHTHSGPGTLAPQADLPGGELIDPYMDSVTQTVEKLTGEALASAREGTLAWHQGHCGLAQNRDLPDPDADAKRLLCGYHKQGTPDGTLLVGRLTDTAGNIFGTLVNYACHPVTLAWDNRKISPDYVGAMRELIEKNTNDAPCLFLQGASGEQAPREEYLGDTDIADAHGREIGYATLSILEGMLPHNTCLEYSGCVESGAPLATWERKPFEPSEFAEATQAQTSIQLKEMPSLAEIEAELASCEDRVLSERLRRYAGRRRVVGDDTHTPLPFWVWRLGEAFFIGHPCEAYSCYQLELREKFPSQAVIVTNLTNGTLSYLPPKTLFKENVYQVWVTPLKEGCLEQLTEECVTTMENMRVPEAANA